MHDIMVWVWPVYRHYKVWQQTSCRAQPAAEVPGLFGQTSEIRLYLFRGSYGLEPRDSWIRQRAVDALPLRHTGIEPELTKQCFMMASHEIKRQLVKQKRHKSTKKQHNKQKHARMHLNPHTVKVYMVYIYIKCTFVYLVLWYFVYLVHDQRWWTIPGENDLSRQRRIKDFLWERAHWSGGTDSSDVTRQGGTTLHRGRAMACILGTSDIPGDFGAIQEKGSPVGQSGQGANVPCPSEYSTYQ